LKKRERGELLIQKTARLFENFLAPVQQPMVEKTFLAFDQIIQLIACDMPTIHSTIPSSSSSSSLAQVPATVPAHLTLSVVVNEPFINSCQEIDQHCELSCASLSKLIARNSFIIRRIQKHHTNATASNNEKRIEYLKYGQDFMLQCYGCKRMPLYVYSMPKNPFAARCHDNIFKAHGEMKQFVGLALQNANNNEEEPIPSAFFHWRFYHTNPDMRYETIGENVPVC
jgi:hypothetical protein